MGFHHIGGMNRWAIPDCFVIGFSFALAVVSASAPARAQGVPAGTVIESRADAAYEVDGIAQTAFSNTDAVRIAEVIDVAMTPVESSPVSTGNGSAVLTFELTNTGNGAEAFTLTARALTTGIDFEPTIVGIALDSNGNGTYEEGIDTLLPAPETSSELAQGASQTIFVLAGIPNGTASGSRGEIELRAEATTGTGSPGDNYNGAGEGGTDAVIGSSGGLATATGAVQVSTAVVRLIKSSTLSDPFGGNDPIPGATIRYAIRVEVSDAGPVTNLIVTDPIPEGVQYTPGSLMLDGVPLTDPPGDDAGQANASEIVVSLGNVAANTSQDISFDVVIES
jgi:uncharacterized repeat protein (TIGR01451 family)